MTTITQTRPAPLSDAQREVLGAAAQQPEGAVIMPARLKGKAASRIAEALLGKALVREIRAKGELPVWRTDESGKRFVLVLTKTGRALVSEHGASAGHKPIAAPPSRAAASDAPFAPIAPASLSTPRADTKLAAVIALLRRDTGSSVTELMAATGWLPHTTRAALTGLRKRGYDVTRQAAEAGSGSVYRITSAAAAAA